MSLLGISRELQFVVHNRGESLVSSCTAREGGRFYKEEKEVGRARVKQSVAFHWPSPYQERRGVFILPFGSAIVKGCGAPPSGLRILLYLAEDSVCKFFIPLFFLFFFSFLLSPIFLF